MPRATKRCGRAGCDEKMPCATHKPVDRRPPRNQRGYDAEYDRASSDPAYVAATECAECGGEFTPDNPKTKGHKVAIRHGGSTKDGIEAQCRRCNYGWRTTAT